MVVARRCSPIERRGRIAKLGERCLRLVDQLLRDLLRPVKAQELGVGRLVHRLVFACRLAKILRRGLNVEDVVCHLESEADLEGVLLALGDRLCANAQPCDSDRGAQGHAVCVAAAERRVPHPTRPRG